jgi:hypothetical protein
VSAAKGACTGPVKSEEETPSSNNPENLGKKQRAAVCFTQGTQQRAFYQNRQRL